MTFVRPRLAAAACVLLAACSLGAAKTPAPKPPEVGYVTLAQSRVTISNELTGRVSAAMSSEVRPQVDGVIRKRLFTEGANVRVGQPLYQIDDRNYRAARDAIAAQLENASAAAADAAAKARRYQSLTDADAASRQEIDDALAAARQAEAVVRQYKANLETANLNLEFTRVLAPISGRIGRSSVTPGALVSANQASPLATIQQLDPIYVDITQSSAQLLDLRRRLASGAILPANATAHLKLDDGSVYPQAGTIEFAEASVDPNTGAVTLRARFPNPDGVLLPGMFVRVETPEGVLPRAVMAPQQGISRDASGGATALVIGAGGKVELRHVEADTAIGDKWLVTSGLAPGDKLIVQGTDRARPGAKVTPVAVKLADAP
jgi:membrane fusion protein (multidrug efflux system)